MLVPVTNDTGVLLGTAQAAERLEWHRAKVERAVRSGTLTPVARGAGIRGAMFFRSEDVDALRAGTDAAATPSTPVAETPTGAATPARGVDDSTVSPSDADVSPRASASERGQPGA